MSTLVTRDDIFELLDIARFGACAASPEGTVVFWNRRAAQIAGLPASQVTGRPCREVIAAVAARLAASGAALADAPIASPGSVDAARASRARNEPALTPVIIAGQCDDDVLTVYLFDDSLATSPGAQPGTDAPDPAAQPRPGTGMREGEPPKGAPSVLSRREAQILRLVAAGIGTDHIAADLQISVHTVRNHVRNMRRKLGAKTKLDAVVTAIRRGLL